MELKLADSPLWTKSAIKWFIFAAIMFLGAGSFDSYLYLISGILAIAQGIYLLTRMTSKTYLTLQNELLIIHLRRFIFGKREVKYQDINKGELIDKHFILYLKNGQQVKLHRDWLSYDDYAKLKQELKAHAVKIR